jgi:hypothetical protein
VIWTARADRLRRAPLSNGKFTGADLAFQRRLTKIQFPDVLIERGGHESSTSKHDPKRVAPRTARLCGSGAKAARVRLKWRETMLSPHEFATLLLVKDAPNQVDMERQELDALLERQLVQLEQLASGRQQWRITESGDSALRAIKRFS